MAAAVDRCTVNGEVVVPPARRLLRRMGDELGHGAVQGHSGVDGLVVAADVESWLLDSDPALRWQVERDISGDPPSIWEATRARIAREGFGARLLGL
jgi:hypothetical protein